jgi:hypothetical protein
VIFYSVDFNRVEKSFCLIECPLITQSTKSLRSEVEARPERKHHFKSDTIVLGIDGAARDLTEGAARLQQSLGLNRLLHRQGHRALRPSTTPERLWVRGGESRPAQLRLFPKTESDLTEACSQRPP